MFFGAFCRYRKQLREKLAYYRRTTRSKIAYHIETVCDSQNYNDADLCTRARQEEHKHNEKQENMMKINRSIYFEGKKVQILDKHKSVMLRNRYFLYIGQW